jgi:hypothetical protein
MSDHGPQIPVEEERLDARMLLLLGGAAVVICTLALVVAGGLVLAFGGSFGRATRDRPPPEAPASIGIVNQNPLQRRYDARSLERDQRRRLEGWEWVDRERRIARLPIDRAMEVVLSRERGR